MALRELWDTPLDNYSETLGLCSKHHALFAKPSHFWELLVISQSPCNTQGFPSWSSDDASWTLCIRNKMFTSPVSEGAQNTASTMGHVCINVGWSRSYGFKSFPGENCSHTQVVASWRKTYEQLTKNTWVLHIQDADRHVETICLFCSLWSLGSR